MFAQLRWDHSQTKFHRLEYKMIRDLSFKGQKLSLAAKYHTFIKDILILET